MSENPGDTVAVSAEPVPQDEASSHAQPVPLAAPEKVSSPSWWQRLVGRFRRPGAVNQQYRLRELDEAIALHPDTVVNYVLRGEFYLKQGETDLAASDFRRALKLAAEQVETNNWGIIAQAMYDRAEVGLRQAERRSGRRDARQPENRPNRLLDEDVIEKRYGHSTETED
jgi:tetratricopeptide (TPR) repeat protein